MTFTNWTIVMANHRNELMAEYQAADCFSDEMRRIHDDPWWDVDPAEFTDGAFQDYDGDLDDDIPF